MQGHCWLNVDRLDLHSCQCFGDSDYHRVTFKGTSSPSSDSLVDLEGSPSEASVAEVLSRDSEVVYPPKATPTAERSSDSETSDLASPSLIPRERLFIVDTSNKVIIQPKTLIYHSCNSPLITTPIGRSHVLRNYSLLQPFLFRMDRPSILFAMSESSQGTFTFSHGSTIHPCSNV
jgi:hypothetical protein